MLQACKDKQTPVEPSETEGPATTLTFLGIKFDSLAMELHQLKEKLKQLQQTLALWRGKKACVQSQEDCFLGA